MIKIFFFTISILVCIFSGCLTPNTLKVLVSAPKHIDTVVAITKNITGAISSVSEEEEYYIGRAVAARLLKDYKVLKDEKLTEYLNLIGKTISLFSNKPYTYGGYHIALVETPEIYAFACPGGIILISRGIIQTAKNEDEIAGVIAHEIAHVNNRDGIDSIKKNRWTQVVAAIGSSVAKQYASEELSSLVDSFNSAVEDIVSTLVMKGYSRSQEYFADEQALIYLSKAGYKPYALKDFLNRLIKTGYSSEKGLLKTHPSTSERVYNIIQKAPSVKVNIELIKTREERFLKNLPQL